MRSRLTKLLRPELDFLIENCNFSEDEKQIISLTSTGKSEVQIALMLNISLSCVSKTKHRALNKIFEFLEVIDDMTTIYVNGKPVTKEELKNYEIKIESVKRLILQKLTNKQ